MIFRVFEIKTGYGYTFLVGCKNPPTSRLREQIGTVLAGAWGGLFDGGEEPVPDYGFELVPDSTNPTGETELPVLMPGKSYVVFVLLESESGSSVGEPETANGILRAIESSVRGSEMKPRIALVTLYNCSVQVLESKTYNFAFLPPIIMKDPFDDDFPMGPNRWG